MAAEKHSTAKCCSAPGCEREATVRGLCRSHYRRARYCGELDLATPIQYGPICSVPGCGCASAKKGYCNKHYRRMQRKGTLETVRQPPGGLVRMAGGYLTQRVDGKIKLHHVRVAEKALGKPMPKGAEVHHVNENPSDNSPGNLVVCPDRAYHMLLHARMRAVEACGHADWKRCCCCKQHDDPSRMSKTTNPSGSDIFYHKACAAKRQRERKAAKRVPQTDAVAAAMSAA